MVLVVRVACSGRGRVFVLVREQYSAAEVTM